MEETIEIPPEDLERFKSQVSEWLNIDSEIKNLDKKKNELKKNKNKRSS